MTFVDEDSARRLQPQPPIAPTQDEDPSEQWLFQFHENLLLTVQAIYRLRQAMADRMP